MSVREGAGWDNMHSVIGGAGWENMYSVGEGGRRRICIVSVREGAGWENQVSVKELLPLLILKEY